MTDFDLYFKKRASGLAVIEKIDGNFAIKEKRFDEETGEEKQPKIEYFNVKNLIIRKKHLEEELDKINQILSDIAKVDKTVISSIKKELNY